MFPSDLLIMRLRLQKAKNKKNYVLRTYNKSYTLDDKIYTLAV